MEGLIKGEFKQTGDNEVDEDFVVKKWNHLWWISKYHNQYRLIKYVRKDSPNTAIKLTITEIQAKNLIDKLDLQQVKSDIFTYASSFKRLKKKLAEDLDT